VDLAGCVVLYYLFMQVAVIFNSWKLLYWDDPRWKSFHKDDGPNTLKTFCVAWIVITPIVLFLDVVVIFGGCSMLLNDPDPSRFYQALPFLVVLFASTLNKTQFIHMCYLVLKTGRTR